MAPARILESSQRVEIGTFVVLFEKDEEEEHQVVRLFARDLSSKTVMKWKCCVFKRFVGSSYQGDNAPVHVGLGANIPQLFQTDEVISVTADKI